MKNKKNLLPVLTDPKNYEVAFSGTAGIFCPVVFIDNPATMQRTPMTQA